MCLIPSSAYVLFQRDKSLSSVDAEIKGLEIRHCAEQNACWVWLNDLGSMSLGYKDNRTDDLHNNVDVLLGAGELPCRSQLQRHL